MILFGDTSGWAAFFNRRDQFHKQTVAALQESVGQAVTFAITDYIFDETLTLLRYRSGHSAAVQCGQWLLESPLVRHLVVSAENRAQAWGLFRQYDDQDFSFTDCVSFVVMREHNLRDAFAFDRHFAQMGFRVWPAGQQ